MKVKAYIIAFPKSIDLETILNEKPELRTYGDVVNRDDGKQMYSFMEEVLQEIKGNIEINISGDFDRKAILYYIIEYAKDHNQLLGEVLISGNIEKVINVEATGVKESTRHHILQQGLLDGIIRRLNGV